MVCPMLLQQWNEFSGAVVRKLHPCTIDGDQVRDAWNEVAETSCPFHREEYVTGSPDDERGHFEFSQLGA